MRGRVDLHLVTNEENRVALENVDDLQQNHQRHQRLRPGEVFLEEVGIGQPIPRHRLLLVPVHHDLRPVPMFITRFGHVLPFEALEFPLLKVEFVLVRPPLVAAGAGAVGVVVAVLASGRLVVGVRHGGAGGASLILIRIPLQNHITLTVHVVAGAVVLALVVLSF